MITRVSQRGLYSTQIYNMNNSLAKLVELNEQSSTQKRINKPSDDPTGAARVLAYRDSMNATDRYQANITSAQG